MKDQQYYWLQTQAPAGNWTDNLGSKNIEDLKQHGEWLHTQRGETIRIVERTDRVIWRGK